MNREDGFAIADLDTSLLHDQKVIVLARATRNERVTATRLALYVGLILESWAAGDRVTLDESLPAWWMASVDEDRAALIAAGLIDEESRLPESAWQSWFIPAFDRREKRRQSGAEGGRRSWQSRRDKRKRSDASATVQHSSSDAEPVRPPGRPTAPTSPAGRESSSPPRVAAAAVTASDEVEARRALAKAIRDATNPDLRKRHTARFETQYGHLYPDQESAA